MRIRFVVFRRNGGLFLREENLSTPVSSRRLGKATSCFCCVNKPRRGKLSRGGKREGGSVGAKRPEETEAKLKTTLGIKKGKRFPATVIREGRERNCSDERRKKERGDSCRVWEGRRRLKAGYHF